MSNFGNVMKLEEFWQGTRVRTRRLLQLWKKLLKMREG